MAMLRILLAFAVLAMAAILAADSAQPPLLTFVFGDSLTEVGNNNFLQSLARANYPWYGVDYEGGRATGRFTNGRTIGDILSSMLGIPPPPPYLSILKDEDAATKGANYASGGAGILNETGLYFIQRLTFNDQINYFNKTKRGITAKIGKKAADQLCHKAIFFVGIGSNDYVNNFLQPFMADGQQYTHDEFVELLASTLERQLTRLHQMGARKIMFHGIGPLGCIPSQRVKSKRGQCLNQVNTWVQQFNARVENLLMSLNRRLPYARFTFVDTYQPVMDLINNPRAYGFKVSNTSCCNVDTSIGGLCLPNSKLCMNRTEFVFWDAFHPSDAANQVLANRIFSTFFSHSQAPAPSPEDQPPLAPSPSPEAHPPLAHH